MLHWTVGITKLDHIKNDQYKPDREAAIANKMQVSLFVVWIYY